MHLSAPIESLVPGLRGRVLTALVRSPRPMSLREVARKAESTSPGSVKLVLTGLIEQGLAQHSLITRGSTFFELNRDHLLAKYLVDMDRSKEEVLDVVREHVATWAREPRAVVLFGSVARGDDTAASDIDVLIVWKSESPPSNDWDADSLRLVELVYRQTGNALNLLVFTDSEWQAAVERYEPIVGEVERDGVSMVGTSIRALLATGRRVGAQ